LVRNIPPAHKGRVSIHMYIRIHVYVHIYATCARTRWARILYPRVLCTRAIYPRRFVHSFARIHKREAFVEPCKSSARCTNTGARSTFARTRTLFSPSSFPRSLSSFNRNATTTRFALSPFPFSNPLPLHSLSLSPSLCRLVFPSPSLLFARLARVLSDTLGVPRTHSSAPPNRPPFPSSPSCTYLRPWPSCVHAYLPSLSPVYTRELSLSLLHEQIRIPRARERT